MPILKEKVVVKEEVKRRYKTVKNDIGRRGVLACYVSPLLLALRLYLGMVLYRISRKGGVLLVQNAAAWGGTTLIHCSRGLTTHRFYELILVWKDGEISGFSGFGTRYRKKVPSGTERWRLMECRKGYNRICDSMIFSWEKAEKKVGRKL
jgi:hypothetical protein